MYIDFGFPLFIPKSFDNNFHSFRTLHNFDSVSSLLLTLFSHLIMHSHSFILSAIFGLIIVNPLPSTTSSLPTAAGLPFFGNHHGDFQPNKTFPNK